MLMAPHAWGKLPLLPARTLTAASASHQVATFPPFECNPGPSSCTASECARRRVGPRPARGRVRAGQARKSVASTSSRTSKAGTSRETNAGIRLSSLGRSHVRGAEDVQRSQFGKRSSGTISARLYDKTIECQIRRRLLEGDLGRGLRSDSSVAASRVRAAPRSASPVRRLDTPTRCSPSPAPCGPT